MEDDEKNAYFESARAIGGTAWHTLRRHVWPNITAPVIVVFSITIGGIIIAYAAYARYARLTVGGGVV